MYLCVHGNYYTTEPPFVMLYLHSKCMNKILKIVIQAKKLVHNIQRIFKKSCPERVGFERLLIALFHIFKLLCKV